MSKLIGSFLEKAEKKADEPFLSDCGASSLTFAETVIVSGRVYRYLQEKGIGREDFVMLLLPRGVQAFAAMIGVWRAGAAFVALEEGYPEERVNYIRKDCGCKLTIDLDEWQKIQKLNPLSGYETVSDHDSAFAVYTSGSTGNPKGVLHEYGNLDMIALSQIVDIRRFGLIAPTNFVASVIALISSLDRLFTFFIVPYSIVKNPALLIQSFNENAITETFCAPSVYRLFAQIPSLKNIIVASEPAFGIWSEDPGRRIYNFYVSSETGYIATAAELDKPNESAPIGKPTLDIQLVLRDEEGRDAGVKGEGEICVPVPYVRGYINLSEQTSHAFVNGEFRTGDLARRTENGDYVIIGRADDMIKINGNRVEPGEIENAARRLLGLREVIAKGFVEGKDAFICLYYTDEKCPDAEEARQALMKALPYYMIPTYFIKLDALPRTQSGKVSRRLLQKPEIGLNEGTYAPPEGAEEEALCKAMAKVLSVPRIGADDDFYTLGGNSISAMEVVSICDLSSLNVTQIFRGRTPRKIAALYLEEGIHDDGLSEQERIKKAMKRSYPLTEEQCYMFDYQLYTPKSTMLNVAGMVRFNEKLDADRLLAAVNAVIKSHPALQTSLFINIDGEIEQRYTPKLYKPTEIEDISEKELEEKRDFLIHPFERLTGQPLIRSRIFRTEEALYWFYDIHHMFFDGTSGRVMIQEVCDLYLAKEWPKPKDPDGYYLMLHERQQHKNSPQYKKSLEYFKNRYEGRDYSIRLDCEMNSRKNRYEESEKLLALSEEELTELEETSGLGKNGLFIITVLLAMAAMNGKPDVLLAWVYKGRDSKYLNNILGLLFRELPVALSLSGETTLQEVYADIGEQIRLGIAHSDYPYIDKNSSVRTTDHFVFIYQEDNWDACESMPIDMEDVDIDFPDIASETAMDVEILDTDEGLLMFLEYSIDRYRRADVRRFINTMVRLIRAMISFRKKPDTTLSELFVKARLPFPERCVKQHK